MEGQNSMILKSFFFQFKLIPITRQKWMSYFSISTSIFYHFLPSQDWTPASDGIHHTPPPSHSNSCGSSIPNGSLRHQTCVWLFTTHKALPKNISPSYFTFTPTCYNVCPSLKIKCIKHFCIAADSIVLVLLISYLLG